MHHTRSHLCALLHSDTRSRHQRVLRQLPAGSSGTDRAQGRVTAVLGELQDPARGCCMRPRELLKERQKRVSTPAELRGSRELQSLPRVP